MHVSRPFFHMIKLRLETHSISYFEKQYNNANPDFLIPDPKLLPPYHTTSEPSSLRQGVFDIKVFLLMEL